MARLHYPRVIRTAYPRPVSTDARWRSACHCGWTGRVFSAMNDAYEQAIVHIAMFAQTCAACGDVGEFALWEQDGNAWILCQACAGHRAGRELRDLRAELAV